MIIIVKKTFYNIKYEKNNNFKAILTKINKKLQIKNFFQLNNHKPLPNQMIKNYKLKRMI